MYFKRTKFLIIGMSRSGRAACKLLLKRHAGVYIFDENPSAEVAKAMNELNELGATTATKDAVRGTIDNSDVVVLSPGVPIDGELPSYAIDKGKCVIGELELAYIVSRCPIIAVTGTNGKTTTCSLIYEILKKAELKCALAGNVGTPLSSVVDDCDEDTLSVVEVSSFQLETVKRFAPHIACILNITPDHMNRHYNMENYTYLKSKLIANLSECEYAVLSADDEIVCKLGEQSKGRKVYFSVKKQTNGAYIADNKIFWRGKPVLPISELKLSGIHNLENALAAVCVAKLVGVDDETIVKGVCDFSGVKHRQEKIAEKNGIVYIDDSKATNPDSALKAVESCGESIVLLVGGIDKGFGYNTFFENIAGRGNVRAVIVYGKSRKQLYRAAENACIEELYLTVGFDSAVRTAFGIAKRGDTVLLSPACASFDEFTDFEERGDAFAGLVKSYIEDNELKRDKHCFIDIENKNVCSAKTAVYSDIESTAGASKTDDTSIVVETIGDFGNESEIDGE